MTAIGPYGIENAILDRLQEAIGPLATVASGAAISAQGLSVGELAVPLAVVEPRAAEVSAQTARADSVIEDQSWLVSLVVRHDVDRERLRADYSELDTLVLRTISALTGWQPPTGVRELRYQSREDALHEPGLLEVGLMFSVLYHLNTTASAP